MLKRNQQEKISVIQESWNPHRLEVAQKLQSFKNVDESDGSYGWMVMLQNNDEMTFCDKNEKNMST